MSKAIDNLTILYNNPLIFTPIICSFYKSLGNKNKGLLLSYLILPLVLYPMSQEFLKNANKTSSIRTLLKNKNRIYGLQNRINNYRSYTNKALQYALSQQLIQIDQDLNVIYISDWKNDYSPPNEFLKAAKALGGIFAEYDVPTIYRMFGVKQL